MNYTSRSASAADEPFLWQMLYYAAHMDEDGAAVKSARTDPDLMDYVAEWGERANDLGVIALAPGGGEVGAAWMRVMPAQSPLYRFVVPGTPEVAIAVAPDHLGAGAGTLLLRCLLEAASCFHPRLALSVRAVSHGPVVRPHRDENQVECRRVGASKVVIVSGAAEPTEQFDSGA